MKEIPIGTQLDIQRSDGRIHAASVSGVDADGQSVTVEWFEHGETKGKEIKLDQLFDLNPQLKELVQPQKPVRYPQKRQSLQQKQSSKPSSPDLSSRPSRNTRAKSMAPALAPAAKRAAQSKQPAPDSRSLQQMRNIPSNDDTVAVNQVDDTMVQNKALDDMLKENQKPPAGKGRRSNCVKEVEKLRKQREDRRAQQKEVKKEKEKIQLELDPGNPNWQFLKMIREFQMTLEREAMSMTDPIVDHQICVCVRKRPINKKEINKKEIDIITVPSKENLLVHECKLKVDLTKYLENHKFRFDYSFDESCNNEMIYRYSAKPLVDSIFQGGMATCFAYGQTGSGKTHTMGGDFSGKQQDCTKGIYAYAANDVFKLQNSKYKSMDLIVSASFFEIYSGKVFDLLNKRKKLQVLEDGKAQVQVVNLQEMIMNSASDVLKLIEHGMKTRTSGTTSANQNSSRSHAILQIVLRKRGMGKDGSMGALHGKFSLIDLAGNERGADTISSDRQTRLEGAEINKSLLALKECIRALGKKGAHLPFRASKLTQVLRDSFIGDNAKTCMIAMISPGMSCTEHSLNTLRYADRVKELGPEGSSNGKKNIIDLDYSEEQEVPLHNSQSSEKYRNSELAELLSTRDDNLDKGSDELYNFHEAVSLLMESEEQVIEAHRTSAEDNKRLLEEEMELLDRVENDVDCDIEEYVHRLDMIVMEKIEKFTALKEKINLFVEQLKEEEKASKNVKRLPFV